MLVLLVLRRCGKVVLFVLVLLVLLVFRAGVGVVVCC